MGRIRGIEVELEQIPGGFFSVAASTKSQQAEPLGGAGFGIYHRAWHTLRHL